MSCYSQRAFRYRKQSQTQDLEDQVRTMTLKLTQVESEKEDLQNYVLVLSKRQAREIPNGQPPVQLSGTDFDGVQNDLLDVIDTLASTSGHRRGSTQRVLVLVILACMRSLTSGAACGSVGRENAQVDSAGGCDGDGCR